MEYLENLQNLDRAISVAVNGCHSEFWDSVMIFLSNKYALIPFYVMILLYVLGRKTFRIRRREFFNGWMLSLMIVLACVVTFFIIDMTGHDIIKPYFQRLRPGYDFYIWDQIRTPDGKGGAWSFVSNHAANLAGLAMVSSLFIKRWRYTLLIFLLMIAVAYSRVYLGRHFLGDVICGAIYGIVVGYIVYLVFSSIILFLTRRRIIRESRY